MLLRCLLDDSECIILPHVQQHRNPPLTIIKHTVSRDPNLSQTPLSTSFYSSRRQSTAAPPVTYVTFIVGDLLIIFYVHRHDHQVFITFQQHHLDGLVASGSCHRGHITLGGRKLNARGIPLYQRTLQCDTQRPKRIPSSAMPGDALRARSVLLHY